MTLTSLVRATDWWNYKIPPLLAVAYLIALVGELEFALAAPALAAFTVFLIGTASFGYFLNDLCDIEADRKADRRNAAAPLSIPLRIAVLAGLTALVAVPWIWLPRTTGSWVLVGLELALFVAYSAPPIRLKARGAPALVADALYAHAVPMLLAVLTFGTLAERALPVWVFALVATWSFLTGLRGILLHQVDDVRADTRAGVRTAVVRATQVRSVSLVARVLLPIELAAFIPLVLLVSRALPYFVVYAGLVLALLVVRALREARRLRVERGAHPGLWRLSDDLDAGTTIERSDQGMRVVSSLERTGNAWDVRLRSRPLLVRSGDRHRLCMRVRSDRARPLELAVTATVAPWERLGPYEIVQLSPESQDVDVEIPPPEADATVCVQMNFGNGVGPVELLGVALLRVIPEGEDVDDAPGPTPAPPDLLRDPEAAAPERHDRAVMYRRRRFADFLGAWILNDFYEKWLPLFPLGLLSLRDPTYLVVAGAHLLLFRSIWPRP